MEYAAKKVNINKKKVEFIYVFFENGDYVSLSGAELVTISVNVYDKLVRHNDGFSPVAESGHIEFKIEEKCDYNYNTKFVCDPQEYKNDRKKYIERRCLGESCIKEIRFFDKLNWHRELLGNFKAEKNGEILKLVVLPQPQMGENACDKHKIALGDIKKEDVFSINLDFENCESFMVFNREIKEIGLEFDEKLALGSSRFHRRAKGGYIKLKLDKYPCRPNHLFDDRILKRKDFERRLCGKKGFSTHDICHLYVVFYHAGFGDTLRECIDLDDMKSKKEVERLIKKEEDDDMFIYNFESGYAKLLKDRTMILTFGTGAKQLMKDLCKNKNRNC